MRPAVFSSELELCNGAHGSFEDVGRSDFDANFSRSDAQGDRVVITSRSRYRSSDAQADAEEKWEAIPQEAYFGGDVQYPQYNADPLDFLTPAEAADLPDLDFPVPDQNVIPEMVFENDELLCRTQPQGVVLPSSEVPRRNSQLIPIQSSVVAHARSGKMSVAAVQERRAKNTEAARRSRARRSDKIAELRQEKQKLMAENEKLAAENAKLRKLVSALESKLVIKEEVCV